MLLPPAATLDGLVWQCKGCERTGNVEIVEPKAKQKVSSTIDKR